MDETLAIVGTGALGGAMLRGLVRSGAVAPDRIVCADARADHLERLAAEHGVRSTTDNAAAVAQADVVLLAVKPQVLDQVLRGLATALRPETLVVSLAAGMTTASIEAGLAPDTPVVRVMSNTPVHVGQAMSVIAAGRAATEHHLATTERLMASVGATRRLEERHLDAVTALSGSGPAYVFLMAEAMTEAGVRLGLPREAADQLVAQTLRGAGTLLADGDDDPATLRDAVTSPGGTTAAALRTLESAGFRATMIEAIEAAAARSRELGV